MQEEVGLYGARFCSLAMLGRPKLAFNFDGGADRQLTIGATGGYRIEIRIKGIASHAGAAPERGVSAITIAALAIADLYRDGWLGKIEKPAGSGTSNVGVIRGGEATNVVTPEVFVRAEARSHDPAFRKKIIQAIEKAFMVAARTVKNAEGKCGRAGNRPAARIMNRSAWLATARASAWRKMPSARWAESRIRSHLQRRPGRQLDLRHGIPTVTLGCGQDNIHTPAERLDCGEFHRSCEIARLLATG